MTGPGNQRELTPDEAVGYWESRHVKLGDRSSGGHSSLGEKGNRILYQIRLAQLMALAGAGPSGSVPLDILDAGCGKGIFARGMAESGYRVHAFDPSESAIAECRAKAVGGDAYQLSTAASYAPDRLFALVYSIDVMFHIMDDGEWDRSVKHLCDSVQLGGLIALVDHGNPEPRRWADYQKTRAPRAYFDIYESRGLRPDGTSPCGPMGYPNVFVIGRRES
ncbi:MAG: class I SAM-dependent methyltransferase [Candidatus Nanopelagicales bacterium]|nr:class I SAM-dependent methyltransferase [Candidatus Nanopelagicales bacterium]MDZ4249901.1 class I SAM-dependent methyltransferase [Candidatus Nanopelagicales bacterium]